MKLFPYLCLSLLVLTGCHSHSDHKEHNHDEHAEHAEHAEHGNHEAEKHTEKADEHAHEHAHEAGDIIFEPHQAKEAGLVTEVVKPGSFAQVIKVSGEVLPAQGSEATVTATMAGIVTLSQKTLTDGVPVSRGQALFSVSAQQMADGNPAAAALAELKAARLDYERAEALAKDGIVSARELEQARLRYETAQTTARSLGNAAQTRGISAPIGGYLKNLLVKTGDYVAAGQALATVTQNRHLQLRADVPERYYNFLPHIADANFRQAADKSSAVHNVSNLGGRLISRGKSATANDYFVPVTFEFENIGTLVPGSFAEIWLTGNPQEGVLSVPNTALTEEQGLFFIYLKTGEHTYRKVEVQPGATDGKRTEIVKGLKEGDTVVIKAVTQVRIAASGTVIPEGHSHSH